MMYSSVFGEGRFLRNVGVRISGDAAAAAQKNATLGKKHVTNVTSSEAMYARRNATCLVGSLKHILT
jgi:hypothetical protein